MNAQMITSSHMNWRILLFLSFLFGLLLTSTDSVDVQKNHGYQQTPSSDSYNGYPLIRRPTYILGYTKTWIDKDISLPRGYLKKFYFYSYGFGVSYLTPFLRLQLWRPFSLDTGQRKDFTLMWEHRLAVDISNSSGTLFTITLSNTEAFPVMQGDKIGWTNENNLLPIACRYVDGDMGMYNNEVQQKNNQYQFPLLNTIISFGTSLEPIQCSAGVEVLAELERGPPITTRPTLRTTTRFAFPTTTRRTRPTTTWPVFMKTTIWPPTLMTSTNGSTTLASTSKATTTTTTEPTTTTKSTTTTEPTTTTTKPTTTTTKATTTTTKPTTTTTKATTTTTKPTTTTTKPSTTTTKPSTTTTKPSTTTTKPSTTTTKPTTTTTKPTTTTTKPTTKPSTATTKATTTTTKPTTTTTKPTTTTSTTTTKPTTTTTKPTTTTTETPTKPTTTELTTTTKATTTSSKPTTSTSPTTTKTSSIKSTSSTTHSTSTISSTSPTRTSSSLPQSTSTEGLNVPSRPAYNGTATGGDGMPNNTADPPDVTTTSNGEDTEQRVFPVSSTDSSKGVTQSIIPSTSTFATAPITMKELSPTPDPTTLSISTKQTTLLKSISTTLSTKQSSTSPTRTTQVDSTSFHPTSTTRKTIYSTIQTQTTTPLPLTIPQTKPTVPPLSNNTLIATSPTSTQSTLPSSNPSLQSSSPPDFKSVSSVLSFSTTSPTKSNDQSTTVPDPEEAFTNQNETLATNELTIIIVTSVIVFGLIIIVVVVVCAITCKLKAKSKPRLRVEDGAKSDSKKAKNAYYNVASPNAPPPGIPAVPGPPPNGPVPKTRTMRTDQRPPPVPALLPRNSKVYSDDVISYNSVHDSDFEESDQEAEDIYLTLEEEGGIKPPDVYYNASAEAEENPGYEQIVDHSEETDYELPVGSLPQINETPAASNGNLQPMTSSVRRMKDLLDKIESNYKPPKRMNSYDTSPGNPSDLPAHEMYFVDLHNNSFNRTLPQRPTLSQNGGLAIPPSYRTMQM